MRFDKQLCFADCLELEAFAGGVVGQALDLGSNGQLMGRQSFVALTFGSDTTATGDPEITFELEFADDADFTDPVTVPLSLPPVAKEDMAAGRVIAARSPLFSRRHVRFLMNTTGEIACTCVTIGFVLDAQTNMMDSGA